MSTTRIVSFLRPTCTYRYALVHKPQSHCAALGFRITTSAGLTGRHAATIYRLSSLQDGSPWALRKQLAESMRVRCRLRLEEAGASKWRTNKLTPPLKIIVCQIHVKATIRKSEFLHPIELWRRSAVREKCAGTTGSYTFPAHLRRHLHCRLVAV
jgi:hypothetical protein